MCVIAVSKSHEFLLEVRRLSSILSTMTPTPSRRRVVIFFHDVGHYTTIIGRHEFGHFSLVVGGFFVGKKTLRTGLSCGRRPVIGVGKQLLPIEQLLLVVGLSLALGRVSDDCRPINY